MFYKRFLPILVAAIALLPLSSCGQSADDKQLLSANQFQQQLGSDSTAQLVDVRTPAEYAEAHLPGAQNMNVNGDDFEQSISKLDKNKPVYLYCRSGARSARAATQLRNNGFLRVYNMKGGIVDWQKQGLPVQ
jgi:thioredoxin 1